MASLNKIQTPFRQQEEEIIKQETTQIRETTQSTRTELFNISDEYNGLYNGTDLSKNTINRLNSDLATQTLALNTSVGAIIDRGLDSNLDNMYLGKIYSYSKVSNSYLEYKLLTPEQKAITKLDKIAGKTYLDRLNFHSKNLNKRTSAIIQNGIRNGFSNQQIAKLISKEININYRHSLTIARTETGRVGSIASERAADLAIEQGLVFIKTWRQYASKDPRHDHSIVDGQTVKAGEEFVLPSGATCQYPRLTGEASEDINWKCEALESFEGFEPTVRRQGREIVSIPDYDVWFKSGRGRQ